MAKFSDFDKRMKAYEFDLRLTPKVPAIIRVDGKAFHTLTKNFNKPYDRGFMICMQEAAREVAAELQGCKLVYVQSDEASFLLSDLDNDASQPWFDYKTQKMCSIAASLMSSNFNAFLQEYRPSGNPEVFDARCFNIPVEDVENYFIWRQRDAQRNAIRMVGSSHYSPKQLDKVNNLELLEMLDKEKGICFNDFDADFRNGAMLLKEQYELNGAIRNRWNIQPAAIFIETRQMFRDFFQRSEVNV